MSESMWSIPRVADARSPTGVMKEQARLLGANTDFRLHGEVSVSGGVTTLVSEFRIVVPILNHYSYVICHYFQRPVSMFPGTVESDLAGVREEVRNQDEFEVAFRKVLGSNGVSELVRNLLIQATAVQEG